MNLNEIQSALFDAIDIRESSHFKEIEHLPKDNEGTVFTLGDCIHDIIYTLEQAETWIERNLNENNCSCKSTCYKSQQEE